MTTLYQRDPRLIFAKRESKCSHCEIKIEKGETLLWYPATKQVECRKCATPTLEALADERETWKF